MPSLKIIDSDRIGTPGDRAFCLKLFTEMFEPKGLSECSGNLLLFIGELSGSDGGCCCKGDDNFAPLFLKRGLRRGGCRLFNTCVDLRGTADT